MAQLPQYDPNLAVETVDELLICEFCHKIMHLAVRIPCPRAEHLTCLECSYHPGSVGLCPQCAVPLAGEIEPAEAARELIEGSKAKKIQGVVVRCIHFRRGCEEVMAVSEVSEHLWPKCKDRLCCRYKPRDEDDYFFKRGKDRLNATPPPNPLPTSLAHLQAEYKVPPIATFSPANMDHHPTPLPELLDRPARLERAIWLEHANVRAELAAADQLNETVAAMAKRHQSELVKLRGNVEYKLEMAREAGSGRQPGQGGQGLIEGGGGGEAAVELWGVGVGARQVVSYDDVSEGETMTGGTPPGAGQRLLTLGEGA